MSKIRRRAKYDTEILHIGTNLMRLIWEFLDDINRLRGELRLAVSNSDRFSDEEMIDMSDLEAFEEIDMTLASCEQGNVSIYDLMATSDEIVDLAKD